MRSIRICWAIVTTFIGCHALSEGTTALALEPDITEPTPSIHLETTPKKPLAQITSVSQLSDVKPTDWAFTAVQSLAERYGCVAGYPDRTYAGQRAIARSEFAVGLSACLDRVTTVLSRGLADKVGQTDLATIKKLQTDFAAELTILKGKVDKLEAQTNQLETQQFSTTTKLNILSSFNLSSAFSSGNIQAEGLPIPGSIPVARFATRNPFDGKAIASTITEKPNLTFSYSTYLLFNTTFTGSDYLNLILAVGNGSSPASVYSSAGFTSTFGVPYADTNPVLPLASNNVGLFELFYSFALSDTVRVQVGPRILPFRQFDTNNFTSVLNGAGGLNSYQSSLANNGLSGAGELLVGESLTNCF